MSETNTVETPTTPAAPAKKGKEKGGKPGAVNGKGGKASANGAPTKKGKKTQEKTERGPSIRLRIFQMLAKGPETGPNIKEKLGLSGVPSLLKDELFGDKPRLARKAGEGRAVLYYLTTTGKAALAKGKIDEEVPPSTGGTPIPDGR